MASAEIIKEFTDFLGQSIFDVDLGSALLENSKGLHNGQRHPVGVPGNVEVLDGSLGLCSPQLIGRNLNGAESISFLAESPEGEHGLSPQLGSQLEEAPI